MVIDLLLPRVKMENALDGKETPSGSVVRLWRVNTRDSGV